MSKTTKTQPETAPEQAVPEFVMLDPASLVIGSNVRVTTREAVEADAPFIASVREQGVLSPITAYTDHEGAPVVITGQRRTLAALITERPQVPVLLYPSEPENLSALRQQWDENERRAAMSEDDRTRGIEQFSLLGLSAEQIAQVTGEATARVDAALSLLGSKHRDSMTQDGLTIEQAAQLAEFEDEPETVSALIEAAQGGQFDHAAAQVRWARTSAEVEQQARARCEEQGIPLVDEYGYDTKNARVTSLTDETGNALDPETHTDCPGHAVSIRVRRGQDGQAEVVTTPWCTAWRKNGHRDRYNTSSGTSGPMSEEEKAERRRVIANNKAWDAAVEVRRAWLGKLATRKTPPPGAEALIAAYITGTGVYVRDVPHEKITAALSLPTMRKEVTNTRTTKGRLTMLALLQVIGAWEAEASRSTWRSPSEWDKRVMAALIAWGYTPSEVEQIIALLPKQAGAKRKG